MASDASVSLGLDYIQFRAGLAQAQKSFEGTMKTFKTLAIATAGVIGVKFSYDAFKSGIQGAITAGKELDIISKQSGIAAKDITLMTHALDRSGQSTEQTAGILQDFRDKMIFMQEGVGTGANAFKNLGLNIDDLKGKNVAQQFEETANAVNSIANPMQRIAVSTAIFGTQGAKAVAAFQSGDVANAVKLFGKNADMQAKAASQLAKVSVSFDRIKTSGMIIFGNIAAKLGPILEYAASKLEGVLPMLESTIGSWIDGAKTVVMTLYNAFQAGDLGEMLWLSLKIGIMKTIDFALGMAKGAVAVIGEVLGQTLSVLLTGNFWKALGNSIIGAFEYAGNKGLEIFMNVFEQPLKFLQDGFTFIFDQLHETISRLFGSFVEVMSKLPGKTGEMFKKIHPEIYHSSSMEKIQSQSGKPTLFGVSGEDARKSAEQGAKNIALAGEQFKQSLIDGGGSLAAIWDNFKKSYESAGIFTKESADAMQQLGALFEKNKPRNSEVSQKSGEEEKKKLNFGLAQTHFDEFRRVGGGAGTAVNNIAQRSLDRLSEIRDLLKKDSKGAQFGTPKGMTGIGSIISN